MRTVLASELGYEGRATDALISICRAAAADTYLSGPGGREYLEIEKFEGAGLRLLFHDYRHPVHAQGFGEFVPCLSAVDLLFNCGPDALGILRSGRIVADSSGVLEPKASAGPAATV